MESSVEKKIRVILADDHTMFRQGLKEMLSTDEAIEVVGEADNGAQAIEVIRRESPDVAVLDVEMPVMGAREAIEEILRANPAPKVVIVTMFEDPNLVREFLNLGASAYVAKSASMKEFLTAVHTVFESPAGDGNVVLAIPRHVLRRAERDPDHELSGRELEVLLLAARGLSNRQAATVLHLAEATIKRHLANIYLKLGVGSRGEAVRKALSKSWISSHDLTREN